MSFLQFIQVFLGVLLLTFIVVIFSTSKWELKGMLPGKSTLRGKTLKSRLKGWKEENEFMIGLGIIMFHFVMWMVMPEWWIKNVLSDWRMWGLQFALIMFAFMIPEGKHPFHHALGRIGVTLVILVILVHLFWKPGTAIPKVDAESAKLAVVSPAYAAWKAYANSKPLRTYEVTPENQEVANKVVSFWKQNLPADAERMSLTCFLESGFRQFEEDGVTPLRGRENPKDVGVCQINEDYWLKKPAEIKGEADPYNPDGTLKKEYDFGTLEGNLKSSLWIYKTYGGDKWNTYKDAASLDLPTRGRELSIMEAPVVGISQMVSTAGIHTMFKAQGPIWIYTDSGGRFASDKGPQYEQVDIGPTRWVKFQSRTTVAVKVIVIR
jgi:hypothetical protein